MGNYVKISRKLLDWEWYSDMKTCRLFLHMILKANWKDGNFKGRLVPRGSFVATLQTLAAETGLTINEVRTALGHMKKTEEVSCEHFGKFSVYKVVNYDIYQGEKDAEKPQADHREVTGDKQGEKEAGETGKTLENQAFLERLETRKNGVKNNKGQADDKKATGRSQHIEEKKEERINNNYKTLFADRSFEMQCTNRLIQSCLESYSGSKVPLDDKSKQEWCVHIDRMKRLDGRTENEIAEALNFAATDPFWRTNIRNTKKLREKFETLITRARSQKSDKQQMNRFNNFNQRKYDFDDLEAKLLRAQEETGEYATAGICMG